MLSEEGWILSSLSSQLHDGFKRPIECPLVEFDVTSVPFTASVESLKGKYPTAGSQPQADDATPSEFPPAPHPRLADLLARAHSRMLDIQKEGPGYESPPRFPTLATCVAPLGPYVVRVYGQFSVEVEEGSVRVSLLNGLLRVVPGEKFVDLM